MSKKNRRSAKPAVDQTPEVTTAVTEPTEVDLAIMPAEAWAEEAATPVPDPTPEPTAPLPAAPPVYWVNDERAFKPRRGFETVLYAALQEQRSEQEVVAHLLSSGEYARVAPQAAALRPNKPTRFLLREWVRSGVLKTSDRKAALKVR